MMKNKRRSANDALQHTYKITKDRGVLFYRRVDHLVYYSMQSVLARKHHLSVLGTSHMFTHIHEATWPEDIVQLSSYEHDLSVMFVREYNPECGRKGTLFAGHYGSAPKRDGKDQRSCLIYVFNNPVEKKLVARAVEDRWCFLAYYEKEYPFSQRPVIRRSRKCLVDAFYLVEHEFKAGRYLKYPLLHRLFAPLNEMECEQLTDFIIQRYFFFDRRKCESLFGSLSRMRQATELTTGKEFDVGEVFEPHSDIAYREMCSAAERLGLLRAGMPLWRLPAQRLDRMGHYLCQNTTASDLQIARFLHRPFGEAVL
jgi:hypothetical protein